MENFQFIRPSREINEKLENTDKHNINVRGVNKKYLFLQYSNNFILALDRYLEKLFHLKPDFDDLFLTY